MAIIDMGSQLNIVSQRVWKTLQHQLVDFGGACTVNDANGGAGSMKGLVTDLMLKCGKVHSSANLHVSNKVPFDLLLGRPWQQGNFIRIDE